MYAYLARFIVKVDFLCVHNIQKDFKGNDEIGIDDGASLQPFIGGEASRMDDAHLLYDRGFTGFSRSYHRHALVLNLSASSGVRVRLPRSRILTVLSSVFLSLRI